MSDPATHAVPISSRTFGMAASTENLILKAIFDLKNPMPHEIKKYLDDQLKPISERTIYRVLKKLSSEGIVVHIDGKYSISQTELRYVGGLFGHLALEYMRRSWQKKTAVDESLRGLVTAFGIISFYMFIEASKPIEDDSISSKEKRESTRHWLQKSFPVDEMFSHFFTTYCELSNLSTNELKKDTIHELTRILEDQYPYEYKQIHKARNLLTSTISGNLRELKKDLPDFLTSAGEGVVWKKVLEKLRKHLSEGGDFEEFVTKLTQFPEESQEILKEVERESQK